MTGEKTLGCQLLLVVARAVGQGYLQGLLCISIMLIYQYFCQILEQVKDIFVDIDKAL